MLSCALLDLVIRPDCSCASGLCFTSIDRFEPFDDESFQTIQRSLVSYIQSEYVYGSAEASAPCKSPFAPRQNIKRPLPPTYLHSSEKQILPHAHSLFPRHLHSPMANFLQRHLHPHPTCRIIIIAVYIQRTCLSSLFSPRTRDFRGGRGPDDESCANIQSNPSSPGCKG